MEAEQRGEERMSDGGGSGGFVTVAIGCLDGRCRALCVIGIMGWFSGRSDAFDGVLDETGAKCTAVSCLSVCFVVKTYICIRSLSSSCFLTNKN